jgi:predicted Zn-dependent protease
VAAADDTARAADAFARAARLMPSFAAAHANLGAALGELERPSEALVALDAAARPRSRGLSGAQQPRRLPA